jgi:hypothetical protein
MLLWNTASSAIQTLNVGISSTLDRLDQTVMQLPGEAEEEEEDGARAKDSDELATCRQLLEQAQMDVVQISQQSRVLLAEKEATINVWKKKYQEATGIEEPTDVSKLVDTEALLTERNALLGNLTMLENKLKEAYSANVENLVKCRLYDDLVVKNAKLGEDYTALLKASELKAKQENETIEHLVEEYTNLGSEFERRQALDTQRIREVEKENERLTIKMLALEHNINEFADKAALSSQGADSLSNGADVKEMRAKLVTLQFDLKEREEEIMRLKAGSDRRADSAPSSPSRASASNAEEAAALRRDVARLQIEKDEAESACRESLTEQRNLDRRLQEVTAQCDAVSKKLAEEEEECARMRQELSVSVSDYDDKIAQYVFVEQELQRAVAEKVAVDARLAALSAQLDAVVLSEQQQREQIAALQAELVQAATASEQAIAALRADHLDRVSQQATDADALSSSVARAVAEESARCAARAQADLEGLRVELERVHASVLAAEREAASSALARAVEEDRRRAEQERYIRPPLAAIDLLPAKCLSITSSVFLFCRIAAVQLQASEDSAHLGRELDRLRAEMARAAELAVAQTTEQLTREFAAKSSEGGVEAQKQM